MRERTVLWDAEEPSGDLAEVRFWVPAFLHANPEAAARAVAAMPELQVVQTQSAGVDNFIGVVRPPVQLCDARGVHGSSTSEWALTAILSVLREFPRFERAQHERRWDYAVTDELAGKSVLIVGAGDVGRQLERRLRACEANPVLVARTARDDVRGLEELADLLPSADVVVLIVPKTSQTVGMVDAAFLARMRDGALLVNAARGPVVVTDALVAELESGRLRAAVDVTDPEPLPASHPLWSAPNLLLTPHVGGSVLGFGNRVAALVAEQIRRFDAGEPLENVVTGEY
ncbi:2-hydroxyacid dehydrogenase [Jatrophihabitans telluris]|uniref:2-hydroxyacid dehydrogenase n=1 Tax=Jatrophihabitans telluris TaxID=2038343 RepID=UPI003221F5A7